MGIIYPDLPTYNVYWDKVGILYPDLPIYNIYWDKVGIIYPDLPTYDQQFGLVLVSMKKWGLLTLPCS